MLEDHTPGLHVLVASAMFGKCTSAHHEAGVALSVFNYSGYSFRVQGYYSVHNSSGRWEAV